MQQITNKTTYQKYQNISNSCWLDDAYVCYVGTVHMGELTLKD